MPGDGTDYYTRLQMALSSVEETQGRIRQLQQRRDEVARQLEGEMSLLASSAGSDWALANCSKGATLSDLRGQLSALQVDFTEKHPRIVMLRDTIDALESDCEQEFLANGGKIGRPDASGQTGEVGTVYQNLRMLLSSADVELVSLKEELRSGQRTVSQLRMDVDKIADVETELKRLNRDYSVIATRHQELLRRWETLQSKKRLDPVTDTVQFNILEPPFSATKPVAPNRPLYLAAVLLLAVAIGGGVAFGLNQLKPVFYNRRTLARVAGIPVLGAVSMIMTPSEVAARKRRNVAWIGANFALLAAGAFAIALADPASEFMRNITGSGF